MIENFPRTASGATTLRVRLLKGDLTVRKGDAWQLTYSSSDGEAPRVSHDGDTVRVEQVRTNGWNLGGDRQLDVELTVPADVEMMELRTGHGRVECEGFAGQLKLRSGHGATTLRRGGGDADIKMGHGDLTIETFKGNLHGESGHGRLRLAAHEGNAHLQTGHGPVELLESTGLFKISTGHGGVEIVSVGGQVDLRTGHGRVGVSSPRSLELNVESDVGGVEVSGGSLKGIRVNIGKGDVNCSSQLETGAYELTTGMGAIEVSLSSNARARIEAQTGFGRVESAFPLVQVGRSGPMGVGGARMVGSLGEGDPLVRLTMRTGKGSLRLRAAGEGGTAAPEWERPRRRPTFGDGPWGIGVAGGRIAEVVEHSAGRLTNPIERHPGPETEQRASSAVERSVGGPIRSAQIPIPPPAVPLPPTVLDDAIVKVLESLARGEITPDEAEQLLGSPARQPV